MNPKARHRLFVGTIVAACVAGTVVLVGIVALVVVVKRLNHPAKVPESFVVPSVLPHAAQPLSAGRLLFDSDRSGRFQLYEMSPDGKDASQILTTSGTDDWWPRLSPDRRTVLLYRTPAGTHDRDFSRTSLWAVGVDGSGLTELRPAGLNGWTFQGHAEWSSDGQHLVMFGGKRTNPQIEITDSLGQRPVAITHRGGTNIDPSYSPDGRTVVFVGCPHTICQADDQEIYTVPAAGGDPTRLTRDNLRDNDPYYSPDGKQLAWLTEISTTGALGVWDIRMADANGADPHRLVGDEAVNSKPQWGHGGSVIYFHRLSPGGSKFDIFRIGVDGSGLAELTAGQPGNNEYPCA